MKNKELKPRLKDIEEWYAKKTNRTVDEFDEYDKFHCHITFDYVAEAWNTRPQSQVKEPEYLTDVMIIEAARGYVDKTDLPQSKGDMVYDFINAAKWVRDQQQPSECSQTFFDKMVDILEDKPTESNEQAHQELYDKLYYSRVEEVEDLYTWILGRFEPKRQKPTQLLQSQQTDGWKHGNFNHFDICVMKAEDFKAVPEVNGCDGCHFTPGLKCGNDNLRKDLDQHYGDCHFKDHIYVLKATPLDQAKKIVRDRIEELKDTVPNGSIKAVKNLGAIQELESILTKLEKIK